MRIVVVGCGRLGARLATELSAAGHDVAIIDKNADAFRRLGSDFKGNVVIGMGFDEDILRKAGAEGADVLMAVTNGDNSNIMASEVAKEELHVKKVMARIYDPQRADAFRELGIDTVCSTVIMSDLIKGKVLKA